MHPSDRASARTSRLNHLTAWLTAFAAVLTLATTFLGVTTYRVSRENSDLQYQNEALQRQIDSKRIELDDVNSQLREAQRQLDQGPDDPSAPPVDPEVGAELRQDDLTLTLGYCADLDSTEPNWRVSQDCGTLGAINGDGDIRNLGVDNGFYGPNHADFAILDTADPPSFATCQAATAYSPDIDAQSVTNGLAFCVRTTADNLALVQIIEVQGPPDSDDIDYAQMSVTAWQQ